MCDALVTGLKEGLVFLLGNSEGNDGCLICLAISGDADFVIVLEVSVGVDFWSFFNSGTFCSSWFRFNDTFEALLISAGLYNFREVPELD